MWGLHNHTELETVFASVDMFMEHTVGPAIAIRDDLDPSVALGVGEFGVALHGDIDSTCSQVVAEQPSFQLAAAAVMGYGYGLLAERGIDFVLQSQYTGHSAGTPFAAAPGGVLRRNYYPGLALYNWTTGALQPRSVVNQIIVAHLEPGVDLLVAPPSVRPFPSSVYALGFDSPHGSRKLLLVNKAAAPTTVSVDEALRGGTAWLVDETYTNQPSPRVVRDIGALLALPAFATAVLVRSSPANARPVGPLEG